MTTPDTTYPKTLIVIHSGMRLISVTDDTLAFELHQRKIKALEQTNAERVEKGFDPVSPGAPPRELKTKHWLAPGFNAIEVTSARFERNVRDVVALFGHGDEPELELVDDVAELPTKQAVAIAKISASRPGIKYWRAVETRKAVIAALDARDVAVEKTKAEVDAEQAKAAAAAGGEAAYE